MPPPKRAEFAFVLTNIGVVDISVDNKSRPVAEFFFANCVRLLAEFQQISLLKKFQSLVGCQSQNKSPRFFAKNYIGWKSYFQCKIFEPKISSAFTFQQNNL